ncbi:MAG: hypothetical protein V7785_11515 [Bermanella sp.]
MKFASFILCIAALVSISIQANAQSNGNEITASQPGLNQTPPPPLADKPPKGKMGGKPPNDAIEMCIGKDDKSACTMNGPQDEEKGFCEYTPDQLYFACNPQRGPQQGPQPRSEPAPRIDQTGQDTAGASRSQVTLYPSHLKSQ